MKKTIITIGNANFRVVTSKKYPATYKRYMDLLPQCRDINDCYERPSSYKVEIYNDWRDWYAENDCVKSMTVSSYNCMQFTLSGCIDLDGQLYVYYISKARQELYPVI